MKVELTKEELDFLIERCFRKQVRLEETGLTDAVCYELSISARKKLENIKKSTLQND